MVEFAKERRTPGSHGEEGSEEDYSVYALSALTCPVGCGVKVEPEGELVEGEGGADSIGHGEETSSEERQGSVACAYLGDLCITGDEKEKDAPDEVVDVATSHLDVTEWTDVMRDGGHEETDGEKGDEETDGGEKEAFVRAVRDLLVDDAADFCEMQNEE
jgi:hypothetical protein